MNDFEEGLHGAICERIKLRGYCVLYHHDPTRVCPPEEARRKKPMRVRSGSSPTCTSTRGLDLTFRESARWKCSFRPVRSIASSGSTFTETCSSWFAILRILTSVCAANTLGPAVRSSSERRPIWSSIVAKVCPALAAAGINTPSSPDQFQNKHAHRGGPLEHVSQTLISRWLKLLEKTSCALSAPTLPNAVSASGCGETWPSPPTPCSSQQQGRPKRIDHLPLAGSIMEALGKAERPS